MRITIIARQDYAGSGQRFAVALRSAGHHATMWALQPHPYGYPLDRLARTPAHLHELQQAIDASDVVHLKGDHLPHQYPELRLAHKPVVVTPGGSGFRRRTGALAMGWEQAWHPLHDYARECQAVGVLTPDLLYPELQPVWVPHTTPVIPTWQPPTGTVVIGHSPSNPGVKGTDAVVRPAIAVLQAMGYDVRLELIHGASPVQCLLRKAACHLFVDQALIPAHGLSGVEAMSMGIPVVQRTNPATAAVYAAQPHAAVIGFDGGVDALVRAIAPLLAPGALHRAHRRTLRYVRAVHGHAAVARKLLGLYRRAMRNARERHPAVPGNQTP